MAIQPLRGMRDFLPEQMIRREYLLDMVRAIFEDYGFSPMETPCVESWDLLGKKGVGGDDVENEVYVFQDKGDRKVGLRFDLTVPMARVIANNPQLRKPFKRYQISRVWRYDRPQAGRYREFWQADVDVIGTERMDAEAECLAVAVAALRRLGFRKFKVRINNRKILNGMIEDMDIKKDKTVKVFRALDKLEKIGKDSVKSELKGLMAPDKIDALMKFVEKKGGPDILKKNLEVFTNTTAAKGRDELLEIVEKAKAYGISEFIEVDFSLVRGLDYYTGPIFEISIESEKSVGSVSGGGRYDNMIEMYGGRWTPAVGISLGVERIFEVMETEGMFKGLPSTKTLFFVASVDDECRPDSIKVAQQLRAGFLNAETDLMGRDFKGQLDYALKSGIPYMIVVGKNELKSGKFTFKDLKSNKQGSMSLDDIIKFFREELARKIEGNIEHKK